jgi:hypothetical protein
MIQGEDSLNEYLYHSRFSNPSQLKYLNNICTLSFADFNYLSPDEQTTCYELELNNFSSKEKNFFPLFRKHQTGKVSDLLNSEEKSFFALGLNRLLYITNKYKKHIEDISRLDERLILTFLPEEHSGTIFWQEKLLPVNIYYSKLIREHIYNINKESLHQQLKTLDSPYNINESWYCYKIFTDEIEEQHYYRRVFFLMSLNQNGEGKLLISMVIDQQFSFEDMLQEITKTLYKNGCPAEIITYDSESLHACYFLKDFFAFNLYYDKDWFRLQSVQRYYTLFKPELYETFSLPFNLKTVSDTLNKIK